VNLPQSVSRGRRANGRTETNGAARRVNYDSPPLGPTPILNPQVAPRLIGRRMSIGADIHRRDAS